MDLGPLQRISIRTPRLELRLADGDELVALARVAEAGVHPPDEMPFLFPWTDPSDSFVEDFISYHEALRSEWQPAAWQLELGVFLDGSPIGIQGLVGKDFRTSRSVSTGSWLGQRFQGNGYGTEMRAAILMLAFLGLGAREARSGSRDGNVSSIRVSTKLGYEKIGESWPVVRGEPVLHHEFRLTRESFLRKDLPEVQIAGLEDARPLFGLSGL